MRLPIGCELTQNQNLDVQSRDEVVRVKLETVRRSSPGITDRFERSTPPYGLQMLGKVVCRNEGPHTGLQRIEVRIVERLDGGLLHGAIHALDLSVGPRVIGLGELVLDAMCLADTIENVPTKAIGQAVSIPWLLGERHAVVCENGVNGVRVCRHDLLKKRRAVLLCCSIEKRHMGELGDAINRQEHVLFSLLQTELTAVDMQVANFGWRKLSMLGSDRLFAG